MKTVFPNRQLAHVWAQGTQAHGRNASNSIFFDGQKIYSYGHHYLMARVFNFKGKPKFALVNDDGYSNTTNKHTGHVTSALRGLMPYFYVEGSALTGSGDGKSGMKAAVASLDGKAMGVIASTLKRSKVTDESDMTLALDWIDSAFATANDLRKILGYKPLKKPADQMKAVRAHLAARLKRYRELNTPEQEAIRKKNREKREELAIKKAKAERDEKIEKFKRFETSYVPGLSPQIIRVRHSDFNDPVKAVVETSGGASVPLDEALTLLKRIQKGEAVADVDTVGHFTYRGIEKPVTWQGEPIEGMGIVVIGCHRIRLEDAVKVLGEVA